MTHLRTETPLRRAGTDMMDFKDLDQISIDLFNQRYPRSIQSKI